MKKVLSIMVLVLLAATLLTACSDSDTAPAGSAPGAGTIVSTGGTGSVAGGNGGSVSITTPQQNGVKVSVYGAANTGFSVPSYNAAFDKGGVEYTAPSGTTTTVLVTSPGATLPAVGLLYTVTNWLSNGLVGNLYLSTGPSGTVPAAQGDVLAANIVTSIKVPAGATLVFEPNYAGGDVYEWAAIIWVANDVDIAGTVKSADLTTGATYSAATAPVTVDDRDMAQLRIAADQMFIRSTAKISTAGTGSTSGTGGWGGYISLEGDNYFINEGGAIDASGGTSTGNTGGSSGGIYIGSSGVTINKGALSANGGNGGNGSAAGSSGYIYIDGDTTYNTASVMSSGGTSTLGNGGGSSGIDLYSYNGGLFNSGSLTANGGDGGKLGGGSDGVGLHAGDDMSNGDTINSGAITANAGNLVSVASSTGPGGSTSGISIGSYGSTRTSGNLTAKGGNAVGTDGVNPYNGGDTDGVSIRANTPNAVNINDNAVQLVQVSGNIDTSGGSSSAGTGGNGGNININQASSTDVQTATGIELLGYASANLSGGNGTASGGNGGFFGITTNVDNLVATYNSGGGYIPAGPIVNEIAITSKGGNAINGGNGGGVEMNAGVSVGIPAPEKLFAIPGGSPVGIENGTTTVTNSGSFSLSGGTGGAGGIGGIGGGFSLEAINNVTNYGSVTAMGGVVSASTGTGGAGGRGDIYSAEDVLNTGTINLSAGAGPAGGSNSVADNNGIALEADGIVTNSASITMDGGASNATNGNGGAGGSVWLLSLTGQTQNSGALSAKGGALAGTGNKGTIGEVWVDGVLIEGIEWIWVF